jgi:hypothetical protein
MSTLAYVYAGLAKETHEYPNEQGIAASYPANP